MKKKVLLLGIGALVMITALVVLVVCKKRERENAKA